MCHDIPLYLKLLDLVNSSINIMDVSLKVSDENHVPTACQ